MGSVSKSDVRKKIGNNFFIPENSVKVKIWVLGQARSSLKSTEIFWIFEIFEFFKFLWIIIPAGKYEHKKVIFAIFDWCSEANGVN